jgi:hypothetical protein
MLIPRWLHPFRRCQNPQVLARTARAVALLAALTTAAGTPCSAMSARSVDSAPSIFYPPFDPRRYLLTRANFPGVVNLITTGLLTKKLGIRAAMCAQTAFPILRILAQAWAIWHDGRWSVEVLVWGQLLTMGGGGAGYAYVPSLPPCDPCLLFGHTSSVYYHVQVADPRSTSTASLQTPTVMSSSNRKQGPPVSASSAES